MKSGLPLIKRKRLERLNPADLKTVLQTASVLAPSQEAVWWISDHVPDSDFRIDMYNNQLGTMHDGVRKKIIVSRARSFLIKCRRRKAWEFSGKNPKI